MANQIVKLKKGSDYLYPYADFMGVDTSNILYSSVNINVFTWNYTAIQDCILYLGLYTDDGDGNQINLNSQPTAHFYTSGNCIFPAMIPLKKNDVVSFSSQRYARIKYIYVYGIKY